MQIGMEPPGEPRGEPVKGIQPNMGKVVKVRQYGQAGLSASARPAAPWHGGESLHADISVKLGQTTHVGLQRLGDGNPTIGLLVIFEQRDQGAPHREPRAIERM